MDEDKFALVEKIIVDIENVMMKNAELCAFDIVPVETNFQNKSPVLYLENCLGLESWCVKHVYMYCYSQIMDKYFAKPKRKALKVSAANADRLVSLINVTLLLNPELNSLWNKRRELVLKAFLEKSSELQFTKLVLSRKPKCSDAFAYRRWFLDLIFTDESMHNDDIQNLVDEELHVCELTSDSSPNNYHSWNHRMWFLNKLKTVKQFDINLKYIEEYEFSEKWMSKHISDYTCFHYRQFCIKNIFCIDNSSWCKFSNIVGINFRKSLVEIVASNIPQDVTIQASQEDLLSYTEDNLVDMLLCGSFKNCNCIVDNVLICRKLEILFHELFITNELMIFYKYHETLWYHRRFVIHEIIAIMYEYFGVVRQNSALVKKSCKKCNSDDLREKQPKIVRYDSNRIYFSVLFNVLICHEKKFSEERKIDGDNYADRHVKYMKFVEGLNNVM
ncbi:protein prenyltransferase alpha subunit repeat-containing protein 1 isoform X2 [Achroia grisella]|uniref:protein prenyltransferase alpha subunit repeat-containing protein 1 isoform X2 n=1 Tax=Achroia grisella TaxID=688607 RepID=UPI0027D2C207|nr:protein prenyltransferase alpha subunit repeat-containing protein 1 isoform X2 [Achroia grisella]